MVTTGHRVFRRSIIFLCMCILTVSLFAGAAQPARAAVVPLELNIDAGYGGYVKEGRWFPVQLTVTNPGDDVSGELAVHLSKPNGGKDVTYAVKVDLPRQSSKIVTMVLPGSVLNQYNNRVAFYEGTVAEEDELPFVQGNPYIEVSQLPEDALLVGVTARDPDTMNFLSLLNQSKSHVQVVRMEMANIPADSMALDGLDVMVFNDVPTDTLKQEQAQAVQTWVGRGGRLFLAGGAGYPKTSAAFEGIAPVAFQGTAAVTELSAFANASGKPLTLPEPFTVSKASVTSGEVVYAEAELPLVVKRPEGSGEVYYVAYDLSLNPVASWNGNSDIWSKILHVSGNIPGMSGGNTVYYSRGLWEINDALDYFPNLLPPALGVLVLIFIAYIILVAPVLYLVLKRFDKREWAWVAIPACSVVFSIGIYAVGAADRGETLAQTLEIIHLDERGQGHKTSAVGVFVPEGGDFQLDFANKSYVRPIQLTDAGNNLYGTSDMLVYNHGDRTRLLFRDVPYWSIRKAWVDEQQPVAPGQLVFEGSADDAGLSGEITNMTQRDLEQVSVMFLGKLELIGELKKGEKKSFSMTASSGNMNYYDYAQMLFPYGGNRDDKRRERSLLQTVIQQKNMEQGTRNPIVIGFSKERAPVFSVDGDQVESDVVSLWVQKLPVSFVNGGQFHIPHGFIEPRITLNNMTSLSQGVDGEWHIGTGELEVQYDFPPLPDMAVTKLSIQPLDPYNVRLQLWNEAGQAWEELNGPVTKEGQEAADYMVSGGAVRVKVVHSGNDTVMKFPQIALEGVVNR